MVSRDNNKTNIAMIKTYYVFKGKEYDKFDKVTLRFNVATSNIETFIKHLNLFHLNKNGVGYSIERKAQYRNVINCTRKAKYIDITLGAVFMYCLLKKLGFIDTTLVDNTIDIFRYQFHKSNKPLLVSNSYLN